MIVQVNVVYVVNGSTKTDVLVGRDVSVQREFNQVSISFPHGDGVYEQEFSRTSEPRGWGLSWVSYGNADKVEKFILESDTPTEVS